MIFFTKFFLLILKQQKGTNKMRLTKDELRELETAEEFGYTLSMEEIRAIQRDEIHKFISKWAFASFWFLSVCLANLFSFQMIAEARAENIIELKALAFIFNYTVNVFGHWLITNTLKGGE